MSYSRAHKNHKSIPAKPLIFGVFFGSLSCAVLLCLAAFLFAKSGNFPQNFIKPITIILAAVGAYIGGYISGKISHEKGMFYGIACGFFMFILFFIGGFIVARDGVTMVTAIRFFAMLLSGAVGGIMGVNRA